MTIACRRLDENNDYTFGRGRGDYISDIDAVAQIIKTRLRLFLKEWWEDQADGLPLFQDILTYGFKKEKADQIIAERVLGSPYVNSITSLSSNYNGDTRRYSIIIEVDTDFGVLQITNE
jgi:hypothetical protein